jgi:hypothetical protein
LFCSTSASIHIIFPDTNSVTAVCTLSDAANGLSNTATCAATEADRLIKLTNPFGGGIFDPSINTSPLEITIDGVKFSIYFLGF